MPPSRRWIYATVQQMDIPPSSVHGYATKSRRSMCQHHIHPAVKGGCAIIQQMDNEIMHHEGLFFFSPSIIQHHSNQQYIYTVCYVWYESRFYLLTSCFFFFLQPLPQSRFWDELRSYQEFDEQFVPTRPRGCCAISSKRQSLEFCTPMVLFVILRRNICVRKCMSNFGRGTEEPFARVASVTAVAKTWACTLSRDRGASPTAIIVMAFSRYRLATGMFWRSINSTK